MVEVPYKTATAAGDVQRHRFLVVPMLPEAAENICHILRCRCPDDRQIVLRNIRCPGAKDFIDKTVMEMKDDHKELLYLLGVKHLSPQEVAGLRSQTDRNIRKVRDVAIRKVQKKLYAKLKKLTENGYDATLNERRFMARYEESQNEKSV